MRNFEDPRNEGNSGAYITGRSCMVGGCQEPAGTAWSPLWCLKHNISRMNQIEEVYRNVERAVSGVSR
jgi:hypothetical protein